MHLRRSVVEERHPAAQPDLSGALAAPTSVERVARAAFQAPPQRVAADPFRLVVAVAVVASQTETCFALAEIKARMQGWFTAGPFLESGVLSMEGQPQMPRLRPHGVQPGAVEVVVLVQSQQQEEREPTRFAAVAVAVAARP